MVNESLINKTLPFFQSTLFSLINKYSVGLVILFLGFIIGTLTSRFVYRVLNDFELNKFLKSVSGINIKMEEIISWTIKIFIYVIFIVYVLNYLNLSQLVVNIIFIVFAIIVGTSIILSVKDFIPDLIGGIRLSKENILQEGDIIEIGNLKGKIKKVDLTHIEIYTPTKEIVFYPNSQLVKQRFKVYHLEENQKEENKKSPLENKETQKREKTTREL